MTTHFSIAKYPRPLALRLRLIQSLCRGLFRSLFRALVHVVFYALFGILLAATASPLFAAHATVGPGNDGYCTHTSFADAVQTVEATDDGPHTIWIRDGFDPVDDTVTLRESMTVSGGLRTCLDSPAASRSTTLLVKIDAPLFRIEGPDAGGPRPLVIVERINLEGASTAASGVEVTGPVDVVLRLPNVSKLRAGGLAVLATAQGAPAVSIQGPLASWSENQTTARQKGAAIYCKGSFVGIDDVSFSTNAAQYGGALYSDGCDIDLGARVNFYKNTAWQGGVIAAVDGSHVRSRPDALLRADHSTADEGQFLWADGSIFELWNARLEKHTEKYSSVIHLVNGSRLELRGSADFCSRQSLRFCAEIEAATYSSWNDDSLIYTENSSLLLQNTRLGRSASRFSVPVIHSVQSDVALESVLLTGIDGESLIRMEGDESRWLRLAHVSTQDNLLRDVPIAVKATSGRGPHVEILSSILWEPESATVYRAENGAGAPDVHCLLTSSPLAGSHVVVTQQDPYATGATDGRLRPDSEAIDFCDGSRTGAMNADIEAEMRGTDQPGVPDRLPGTTTDLGVDEYFGRSGSVFTDGFESGNLSSWSSAVGYL